MAIFIQIKKDSPEWIYMWSELEKRYGDLHGWQYLGTTRLGHSFRHRSHPTTNSPEFHFVKIVNNIQLSIESEVNMPDVTIRH